MAWTAIFQEKAAEYTQNDQWTLEFDDSIILDRPESGWKQYVRDTVGRFKCRRCNRTWPSNKVKVVFHMHLNNVTRVGRIKVRRYRQNCKICDDAPMEIPNINAHYLGSLMENLVKNIRKKFYGEDFGPPVQHSGVRVNSPHEPSHCEACIDGVCDRAVDEMVTVFRSFTV